MNRPTAPLTRRPWWPYVAPMAAFLILTALEGMAVDATRATRPALYPVFYAVKIALVAVIAWSCRSAWRDLTPRPSSGVLAISALAGLLVTALWIGLDGRYPALPMQEERVAFDPSILPPAGRALFLGLRFFGLVLVVPLIEELFWRSFLMRWIIRSDFQAVSIGKVTLLAAAVTSALFALAHPEWLPALLTGLLWAILLRQTRSVAACVVSHLAANLALGIYVLASGNWKFW